MKYICLLFTLLWSGYANAANIDKHLINEMLTTVNAKYLYAVDNVELVNSGVQIFQQLDPNITISKGSDRFYIYYKQQINRIITFPKDVRSVPEWADALAMLFAHVTKISENAALHDFELPDLMMKKMTADLDKYSHYYSEYEYNEEEQSNAIYTLYSDRMIDGILYLKVRIFNKETANMVQASLQKNPQAKGVILDLRGNSGGILNEALKVADFFTDGEIITYTAGRNNQNIHYYTSNEGELYSGPLAVLTDGETASAAEVLAGGLQEQSRAKIIGARTFGKGTIQSITQMSNGGKLVLTTEQFFTPSGKIIHENGIMPDICTVEDAEENECPAENRLHQEEDIETAVKLLHNQI